jgi:hypothetical protein
MTLLSHDAWWNSRGGWFKIQSILPNVVPGASGLRVTGSRTVAGTDQKQHSKPKRF